MRSMENLIGQTDGHLGTRSPIELPPDSVDDRVWKDNQQDAVLQTVHVEDFAEAGPDQRPKPIVHHRIYRTLSGGTASKIAIGHKDLGITMGWHVQGKLTARAPFLVEPKVVQEGFRIVVPRPPMAAHEAAGQNHSRVDFRDLQRSCESSQDREREHSASHIALIKWMEDNADINHRSRRTSVIRPQMAAAATMEGLMIWVSAPRPWRPSKFRLVVDAQRSPPATNSPFDPLHIPHPDSP